MFSATVTVALCLAGIAWLIQRKRNFPLYDLLVSSRTRKFIFVAFSAPVLVLNGIPGLGIALLSAAWALLALRHRRKFLLSKIFACAACVG